MTNRNDSPTTTQDLRASWSSLLQCHWTSLKVAADTDFCVEVHCPGMNYCDMSGAIELCTSVMPEVNLIRVFVAGEIDIVYALLGSSQWEAYR